MMADIWGSDVASFWPTLYRLGKSGIFMLL